MERINYYNKSLTKKNKMLRKHLINYNHLYNPSFLHLLKLKLDIISVNHILYPYKRIYNLPWNIKFLDTKYKTENNYPHTHGDTIFFPSSYFNLPKYERIKLLVHEKIHIYQRYHPIPYHKIILIHFDLQVEQLLKTHKDYQNIRQNPDNNTLIYSDHGQYTLPLFKKNAKTIADVQFKDFNTHNKQTKYSKLNKNEHPNETFAYYLTDSILDKSVPKFIQTFI